MSFSKLLSSSLLCLSLCASCATQKTPRTPPRQTHDAEPHPANLEGVRFAVDAPRISSPKLIQTEADGTRDIVYGALRLRVNAGAIEQAASAPGYEIRNTLVADGIWYFVDVRSNLYRSDSFLGELAAIQLPDESIHTILGVGDTVSISTSRGLFVVSKSRQLTRVALPEHTFARAGVVKSDGRGWLIDQFGRLWWTPSQGNEWTRVSTHDAAAISFLVDASGGIRVATLEGVASTNDDGTIGDLHPETGDEIVSAEESQSGAILPVSAEDAELLRLNRALRTCRLEVGLLSREDGTSVCVGDRTSILGRDALVVRSKDLAVLRVITNVVPEDHCIRRRWGNERAVFFCPSGRVYVTRDGEHFNTLLGDTPLEVLPKELFALADDGHHAMFWGRDAAMNPDFPNTYLLYEEGMGWSRKPMPRAVIEHAIDAAGQPTGDNWYSAESTTRVTNYSRFELKLRGTDFLLINGWHVIAVLDGAKTHSLEIPRSQTVTSIRWLSDGNVASSDGAWVWTPATETLREIRIPASLEESMVLTSQHMFAFDSFHRTFMETQDQGQHWSTVSAPISGDGEHDESQRYSSSPMSEQEEVTTVCLEERCVRAGLVSDLVFGKPPLESGLFAKLVTPPTREVDSSASALPPVLSPLEIECQEWDQPSQPQRRWSNQSSANRVQREFSTDDVPVAVFATSTSARAKVVQQRSAQATTLRFEWQPENGTRASTQRSLPVVVNAIGSLEEAASEAVSWQILDATEQTLLAQRCDKTACRVWMVPSRGLPLEVSVDTVWGNSFVDRKITRQGKLLRSGGALLFTAATHEVPEAFLVVVQVDTTGRFVQRRSFNLAMATTPMITRHEGRVGLGFYLADGTFLLADLESNFQAEFAVHSKGKSVVVPCAENEPSTSVLVPLDPDGYPYANARFLANTTHYRTRSESLRLTSEGLCSKSIVGTGVRFRDNENGERVGRVPFDFRIERARDGTLNAHVMMEGEEATSSCTLLSLEGDE